MRRQDGSLIGEKGVRYGLQKPGVQQARKPPAPAAPAAPRPVNVFGDDDESDEDVETQVARQAEKKRSAAKVQQTYEDALAQDPSVFDYDGVYDTIQESRTLPKQQEKIERKSRYIAQLKEQADHRKREEEVRFERRLMKERQQEDHLYEGKDKFITSAYRKKLEEDKKWVEDQKQKEAEEEANDVRKIGHMGNFYANLLTKNVALGNAAAKPKQSEEQQAASHRDQGKQEGASQREGSSGRGSEEPAGTSQQGKGAEKDAGKEKDTEKEMAAAAAAALQKKRQQQQQPVDKYEAARREAELALREQRESGAGQPAERGEKAQSPAASDRRDQPAAPSSASPPAQAPRKPEAEGAKPAAGQPAALAGGKRRNDDSAVKGARERYQARKKQLTGS